MGLLDGSLVMLADHETVLIEAGTVVSAELSTTVLLCGLHGVIGVQTELDLPQKHQT